MVRTHGAFICARYSTDNQNPDSIEVQVQKCTAWCNEHGLPILGVFADEATSGMKDTRPGYEAMMQQLRLGLADTVVIYDQSRMFRKMTAWFAFRDELSAMGVQVVSVTQPMIGKDLRDPTNFLTEGSMALFNQIWALQSRQKTVEKMRFMAKAGQHTGGIPPLGYQVVDGRLAICEEEAITVRRIFREYADGMSYRLIIAGLNRDGLKTKRGSSFGSNSLHDLLKNEKYIGTLVYGAKQYRDDGSRNTHAAAPADAIRIEDAIPSIIDKGLFEEVQKKMSQNKRQQGGRPPTARDYPLKGKVFCGDCKAAMTVSVSQGKYFYYKCSAKKRTHQCDAAPISVDELEKTVVDAVRSILGTPENAKNLIRILREQRSVIQAGAVAELQALLAEAATVESKLEKALDALLDGLSSPGLTKRIESLEKEKASLEARLRSLKASVDGTTVSDEELAAVLQTILTDPTTSAILSVVSRVEVYKDHIEIWTILDTDPSGKFDYTTGSGTELTITPGTASGVPRVFVTTQFLRIVVQRKNAPR